MVLGSSEMVLLLFSLSLLLLLLLFESSPPPRLSYGFKFLCEIRGKFFKEDIDGGVDDTDDPDEEILSGTI